MFWNIHTIIVREVSYVTVGLQSPVLFVNARRVQVLFRRKDAPPTESGKSGVKASYACKQVDELKGGVGHNRRIGALPDHRRL